MSQVILKDAEQQRYYDALFDMHASRGWSELVVDMMKLRDVYADIGGIDTVEELHFRKGQLDLIDQLLTHKDRTEAGFNMAIEEQTGEEQKATGGTAKVVEPGQETAA